MPLILPIANWMLTSLIYLVLVGAILSWFPNSRRSSFGRAVNAITGPLLLPFRALVPPLFGMDFSPLLAILLLSFLQRLLSPTT